MREFPDITIEFGQYVESFVNWLDTNLEFLFDFIFYVILNLISNIEGFLIWLPWWLFVLFIFLLGWKLRTISSGVLFSVFLFVIGTFGLWVPMMETLAIIVTSVVISIVLGIPIGILMAYNRIMSVVITPILDGMQTMPSFVYLIPAIILFHMGTVPAVFATIIYAIPPVIRLTDLGIRKVSKEMVEAGKSFGASPVQLLAKVQIPQALPTILAGTNQTTMMALAMVVIAAMIGADGLGMEVYIAINRIDVARGVEAGLSIVFLAIIIDRLTQSIGDKFKYTE
ncbi:ABC transporter permease [Natranaerobius thermophilus]|uniref:Binding-protein-dependent transport systems inner membrane component n=1 Tax=Natranaerobius thermophilus (strain ATCC BAA-1301 / DSM 18059 / JW/NM-WN-LF) TaxID=457570 RepID=B2A723_NATTJ|nr:proline/glycine betaine ABC transporter permease [Natranaerobius thermophilus]ACB85614.1 binding-protein-dependent transport systems inner membrane component [Natranaerobius thermophilus JW/NM-WN-LF]